MHGTGVNVFMVPGHVFWGDFHKGFSFCILWGVYFIFCSLRNICSVDNITCRLLNYCFCKPLKQGLEFRGDLRQKKGLQGSLGYDNNMPDIIRRCHDRDSEAENPRTAQSFLVPVKEIEYDEISCDPPKVILKELQALEAEIHAFLLVSGLNGCQSDCINNIVYQCSTR